MEKHIDENSGELTVIVKDLSFLYDRDRFNWFQRHLYNIRHKRALKKASVIIAVDEKVRDEINRYYFIPKARISLLQNRE